MEIESRSKKPPAIERRIILVKDFLRDDMSSCSSSGFKSFQRRTCCTSSIRNLLELDLKSKDLNNSRKLVKTQSKSVETTISVFQKASVAVINVLKNFTFSSSNKSSKQGILPRSFSRRLRRSFWKKKKNDKVEREIKVAVRVKDIMKWKSFRDLIDEDKPNKQLGYSSTQIQTTTTTTSSSICWSESDLTTESLNSSIGTSEFSGETNKVNSIKKKSLEENINNTEIDDKDEDSIKQNSSPPISKEKVDVSSQSDLHSPVSILNFLPSEEEYEESPSSQSSLASIEEPKQKIRIFENIAHLEPVNLDQRISSFELINDDDSVESLTRIETSSISSTTSSNNNSEDNQEEEDEQEIKAEEKARKLLQIIRETSFSSSSTIEEEIISNSTEDFVLLDFFRDEITERNSKRVSKENELDQELLRFGIDWKNGKCGVLLDWGFEESRKVYLREIEKRGKWGVTDEDEQEQIGFEIEFIIMGSLIDELLLDL